jgi:hypothetical protein
MMPAEELTERGIAASDAAHHKAMRLGSNALRDRIHALLAERQGRFRAQTTNHKWAREAIRRGNLSRERIMELYELSPTAYEDLAGQVRAGLEQ